jgi:hypothetical protein
MDARPIFGELFDGNRKRVPGHVARSGVPAQQRRPPADSTPVACVYSRTVSPVAFTSSASEQTREVDDTSVGLHYVDIGRMRSSTPHAGMARACA